MRMSIRKSAFIKSTEALDGAGLSVLDRLYVGHSALLFDRKELLVRGALLAATTTTLGPLHRVPPYTLGGIDLLDPHFQYLLVATDLPFDRRATRAVRFWGIAQVLLELRDETRECCPLDLQ